MNGTKGEWNSLLDFSSWCRLILFGLVRLGTCFLLLEAERTPSSEPEGNRVLLKETLRLTTDVSKRCVHRVVLGQFNSYVKYKGVGTRA